MTPYEAAILCRQRLNLSPNAIPRLLTYIDPALESLAMKIANDVRRRELLMLADDAATAPIESVRDVYFAKLDRLIANTAYDPFVAQTDVIGTAMDTTRLYPDGLQVQVTNRDGEWTGISENTNYYLFLNSAILGGYRYQFASTPPNAYTDFPITMAEGTAGDVLITPTPSTLQVLKDYLEFGTVWHKLPDVLIDANEINASTDTIDFASQTHPYVTGTRVRIIDADGILGGVKEDTDYYLIAVSTASVAFAATYADALAGTAQPISNAAPGADATIEVRERTLVQWCDNPQFAQLTKTDPLTYIYGWLEGDMFRVEGATAGSLTFNVPFIPTLDTLPSRLEDDFISEMVAIAATQ